MNTLTRNVHHRVLPNGLTVLTQESHTAPVVSVQVWYRVGARNEAVGISGISHLLEHLMFKGTRNRPVQFGRLFSALGSVSNAFTSYDMTAYYGTVSSHKLEALLVLEADRMENLNLTLEQLASEKRVVVSELQGYDNSPDYRLSQSVMHQAFAQHPYGWPVGGTPADVEGLTLEQVQQYYRQYYGPQNAVLAIAGDFEPSQLTDLVQRIFGILPAATPVALPDPPARTAQQSQAERPPAAPIWLREPGSTALIEAVYPIPAVNHPDIPALDVLDAVLSVGRHSRFYGALIEPGLASHAQSYSAALIEPGWYNLSIAVAPEQSIATTDQCLQAIIQTLQETPISRAELQRAKTQLTTHFILSNRDVEAWASQLAYNQVVAGDYTYSDRYLTALMAVSIEDVQRVAQTYLGPAQRTVGYFEPSQLIDTDLAGITAGQQTAEDFSPAEPVNPAQVAQYLPPYKSTAAVHTQLLPTSVTLDNGLRLLLLPDASSPTFTLSGSVLAGNSLDPVTKAGLAQLTAATLLGGTDTEDATTLARMLEDRGLSLEAHAYREGLEIEGYGLAADLPLLLQTLAAVLQRAVFPESELTLAQKRAIANLQMELDDPGRVGRRTLQQRLYPETHPFHSFPTLENLQSITRTEVLDFYQNYYRPDQTILVLLGDFDLFQVQGWVKAYFGSWQQPEPTVPQAMLDDVPFPQAERLHCPLSGKPQIITYMGYPSIRRSNPLFHIALVLNHILGGDTLSSRLGSEIRDRLGLTYGIYSYFAAGRQAGTFMIEMQTAPADTETAIQSTVALLRNLREQGVSAAEVEAAKRTLINSYPVELASPDSLAQRLLLNAVDGLAISEIRTFPQQIEAVSLEAVNQAIPTLIQPDHLLTVTAGSLHPAP